MKPVRPAVACTLPSFRCSRGFDAEVHLEAVQLVRQELIRVLFDLFEKRQRNLGGAKTPSGPRAP